MRRSAVGVALTLLVVALSGCNSSSELKSSAISKKVTPEPSAPAPEAFPSADLQTLAAPESTVALTRPTDPDERVRVIKSGRPDPFKPLVTPVQPRNRPGFRPSSPKVAVKPGPTRRIPALPTPRVSPSPNQAVLPPLPAPEPELAKAIKVKGIIDLAGQRQVLVEAPEEKVARTISVGDRISGGRVLLKSFDLSNPSAPKAIFVESGMEVAIGVGQDPIVLASR